MNNGYIVSPGLMANDRRETVVATPHALEGPTGSRKSGRRRSDGKHQGQAPVEPRSIVARQFMRMSNAHDRIRMKVLAGRLVRAR
jgi:hypothetical protein